jgi:hypothetical protein
MGMGEAGRDLDLTGKALRTHRGGQLRAQYLHRHSAMMFEVLGEIHRGHAALSQLPLDAIAVGEGGG